MPKKIELSVLFYQDGGVWVAQALEHDIAAFAETVSDLPTAFERAVAANLCANADLGRQGLNGIPPAPERFQQMFDSTEMEINLRTPHTLPPPVRVGSFRLAEAA